MYSKRHSSGLSLDPLEHVAIDGKVMYWVLWQAMDLAAGEIAARVLNDVHSTLTSFLMSSR